MTPPSKIFHTSSQTYGYFQRIEKGKTGDHWIYKGSTTEYAMTEKMIKNYIAVKLIKIEQ